MKITVDIDESEYTEESFKDQVRHSIVNSITAKYMENIEKTFGVKFQEEILKQVQKYVKAIKTIELDKCNSEGIRETISIEQFITQNAMKALTTKTDSSGRIDGSYSSEKKNPVEWLVKKTLEDNNNEFVKELKGQIIKIEQDYAKSLEAMVTKTLAPLYRKLREQVKA